MTQLHWQEEVKDDGREWRTCSDPCSTLGETQVVPGGAVATDPTQAYCHVSDELIRLSRMSDMVRTDIAPMLISTDTKDWRFFYVLNLGMGSLAFVLLPLLCFGFLGLSLFLLLLRL